ncbi:MAG: hypothetical protein M1835_003795 [Candelina submexicana]|nr:MAG: hypothetical protein M1835_003795 [Candelina submexicana]
MADTTSPTVRLATRDDVPTILQLIHELAAYEHATHEVLATEASLLSTLSFAPSSSDDGSSSDPSSDSIPRPASTFLVITPSKEVAGMALYFHNYSTWRAAPGIYLEDLFIRPAFRRRGYGKMLLARLAAETLRVGGKRLEWSVLKWNQPSIDFYEGIGAKMMSEWVGMRVEGEGLETLAKGNVIAYERVNTAI